MRAYLENRARPRPARLGMAEAGVEEARVMDPELADHGVVGDHLGGVVGRHVDRLLGRQNVEVVGRQDHRVVASGVDRIPVLQRIVMVDLVDVDDVGVLARLVADQPGRRVAAQIDLDRQAARDCLQLGLRDEHLLVLQTTHLGVGVRRPAPLEPDLQQPRALAHDDRETARRDFGVKRPLVLLGHAVELGAAVGDQSGEHVEPPDRALRAGDRREPLAEAQALDQRHDVDAAALEQRALGQVDLVHAEGVDLVAHLVALAGQEARAHPVGDRPQPEVEAGRLDLVLGNVDDRFDRALADQRADLLRRHGAGRARLGIARLEFGKKRFVRRQHAIHPR